MPSKNTVREDVGDSYFHIYSRGANKQSIFLDAQDFNYFIKLFSRYLSKNLAINSKYYQYPNYSSSVNLLAFCLMDNHYHLLAYQKEAGAITSLMKSLVTSYSMYFNLKYKHSGAVFESRFKSVRISNQQYLEHISRYIHLNPRIWKNYKYSSIGYYLEKNSSGWLIPGKITEMFSGVNEYLAFLEDYKSHRQILKEIKNELADK